MSHHWHEDDEYYDRQVKRERAAGGLRKNQASEKLKDAGPDAAQRYEEACKLVVAFTHSAEGKALMEGSYGWSDVADEPTKADILFKNLLLHSGALAALVAKPN